MRRSFDGKPRTYLSGLHANLQIIYHDEEAGAAEGSGARNILPSLGIFGARRHSQCHAEVLVLVTKLSSNIQGT